MPVRLIREGILTSKPVNNLTERGELFYRKLLNVVDDYGRFFSNPEILRTHCYPCRLTAVTVEDVKAFIGECYDQRLLILYGPELEYLALFRFRQQIRSASKFPPPDEQLLSKLSADAKQLLSLDGDEDVVEDGDGKRAGARGRARAGTVALCDLPPKLRTERIAAAWQRWMAHRRCFRKPGNWNALFNTQIDYLEQFTEAQAFEILMQSLRNGWQGLFPPKNYEINQRNNSQRVDRSIGTTNEGTASRYKGLGKVVGH